MYQLFYAGEVPAEVRKTKSVDDNEWGLSGGRERIYFSILHKALDGGQGSQSTSGFVAL
jgi:hypothetical protein